MDRYDGYEVGDIVTPIHNWDGKFTAGRHYEVVELRSGRKLGSLDIDVMFPMVFADNGKLEGIHPNNIRLVSKGDNVATMPGAEEYEEIMRAQEVTNGEG